MLTRLLFAVAVCAVPSFHSVQAQSPPPAECGTILPEGYVPPHVAESEAFAAFERTFAASQAKHRRRGSSAPLRRVPTTVWIIRRTDGTGGLSTAALLEAYRQANVPYVAAGLEFVIGAVNYVDNDRLFDLDRNEEATLVASHYDAQRLNVYFAGSVNGGRTCGYAWFPGTRFTGGVDRPEIVVMSNACATNGSTFAHEFGHSYGLLHTHEPGFGRELVDGSNCTSAGDLICDTPADPQLGYGNIAVDCAYTGTGVDANGMTYAPDPRNLMSYSRKECRDVLSPEQLAVIAFNAQSAPDRQFVDDQPALALFAIANPDGRASCDGSQQFELIAAPGQDSYGWDIGADGIVQSQGSALTTFTYTPVAPGTFDVQLFTWRNTPQMTSAQSTLPNIIKTTPPSTRVSLPEIGSFEGGLGTWDITANSANLRWLTQSGRTSSDETGPDGGYLPGGGFGGEYVYFEASSTETSTATSSLRSPCLELAPGTTAEVELYYHMYGPETGELHFDLERNSGEIVRDIAPALVGQQQTASSDPWRQLRFAIDQYPGETLQLRLRAEYGESYRGDIAVDAISIQSVAPVPVELAAFSAAVAPAGTLLNWSAASEFHVDRYEIQRATVRDDDFAPLGERIAENAPAGADHDFTDPQPAEGTNY